MDNWALYKEQLRAIRRFTGEAFSRERGYDARKKPNFGQRMAVLKYARKLDELMSRPVVFYKPKRGEKTAAFEYTGQRGYNKFDTAIVHKPNDAADLEFGIDRSRPKGSRFVVTDRRNGQQYIHIPANAFLTVDPSEYAAIIREYAPDAEFFMIEAGENYMWGAGGGAQKVGEKIKQILEQYGSNMFDANDHNSSHWRNWFRGVTGFTDHRDALAHIEVRHAAEKAFNAKYKIPENALKVKRRTSKHGRIALFANGRFLAWADQLGGGN